MIHRFNLTVSPARLVGQNLAVDPSETAIRFAALVEQAVLRVFPNAEFRFELGAYMDYSATHEGAEDQAGAIELERLADAIRKTGGYLVYF